MPGGKNADSRSMTNVQIAISDRGYAQALHDLLTADGTHEVHLVECPNPAINGVVVADDTVALDWLRIDVHQYVAFVGVSNFGTNRLWQAGVRHLIQANCPPRLACLEILAAQRKRQLASMPKLSIKVDQEPLCFDGQSEATGACWEELRALRNAIAMAVWDSTEVSQAIDVLKRSGLEVEIEIDAIVVDSALEEWIAAPAEVALASTDISTLDSDDRLFLESLGISAL